MALRYWVGGAAAWDGTAGTKWALTSGGAGGQAIPTSADDVFFDAASGANTVTISTGNTGAKSITCTGFTGTLTGTAAISVAGSIVLVAGMTYTYTGALTITATATLTTGGKTLAAITITAVGGTVTLGSALTSSGVITVTDGIFTTSASNYATTASSIVSNSGTARTITLNASTVTLTGAATAWNVSATNLTFNRGTSTIVCSGLSVTFSTGGQTYYNVSFTNTATDNLVFINGAATFNVLTLTPPAATGNNIVSISGNQTISVLSAAGASVIRRLTIKSSIPAIAYTLTVSSYATKTDVDFQSIVAAGGSAPWSGTRLGNGGNNTSITFTAAKSVYWNLAGTQNWSATGWALTSGGAPALNNFPLAQDTIVFDNTGAAGTVTIDSNWLLGNVDMSLRTSAMTLATQSSGSGWVCGNWTSGTGVTITGSGLTELNFVNISAVTVTCNGVTFGCGIVTNGVGSITLADAFLCAGRLNLSGNSQFNAVTYNVTCLTFSSFIALTMGSGTWTMTGSGGLWTINAGTVTAGTSSILLSDTSTSARTFAGNGQTYGKLTIGGATGTSTLTITGANTFTEIASTKTVAHTIVFPNVTTTVGAFTVQGSSGNVVTLSRTGASGTFTLTKTGGGVVSSNYLSISNSTATPTLTWYAGANSTDGGGNTGWIFTAAPFTSNFFMLFN